MTHTLHRRGTRTNLGDDYVVFAMAAKGINEAGAASKLKEFLRLCLRHGPVNIGDMKTGNMLTTTPEEIIDKVKDTSIVHAVFTDAETVARVLKAVREADLGISVIVSGLFESVGDCCQQAALTPHTVEYSLGIWGQTERLPDEAILEISTMCGHGMVAFGLVEALSDDIRRGKLSPEGAAKELARQCVCGVFNPGRASKLLKGLVASGE